MTPYNFCYVYVLNSMRFSHELYIGFTHNLRKRLVEHNQGSVISTKRYTPWKLLYYEAFSNESFARARELHLKNNGNPMRELKKRIGFVVASKSGKGFTLIETLVAVSLLTIAVVAPMTLASRSLGSAYYARDQITAFYLAQEAIEAVRSLRDAQVLRIAQSSDGSLIDIFDPTIIPISSSGQDKPFVIDVRKSDYSEEGVIVPCPTSAPCPALQTNGVLYGYDPDSSWRDTNFTRVVHVYPVGEDEFRVTVTVSWQTGAVQRRTFTISENMYRWVNDGSSQL